MTEDEVRAVVLGFPQAEDGTSYGQPSFKVRGKFFTRLRAEDASLVLSEVSHDEREMLITAAPETFHLTSHYQGYPMVLARIESLDAESMRSFLERRWRKLATRAAVKAYDAGQGTAPAGKPKP